MGLGEYISVSSQRDSERSQLATEQRELDEDPERELDELAEIYARKGLKPSTARLVAIELTDHDALTAHADAELRIDARRTDEPSPRSGGFSGVIYPRCTSPARSDTPASGEH